MNRKPTILTLKQLAAANVFSADFLLSLSSFSLVLAALINLCPESSVCKSFNKDFSRNLVPVCLGALITAIPWKISAKNFQSEIDEETETNTPCRRCVYYSHESQAKAFLKHPCALHPSGKPDIECRDWDKA